MISAFPVVSDLLVKARFGQEIHSIKEFVRPQEFMVEELHHRVLSLNGHDPPNSLVALWARVHDLVRYPRDHKGMLVDHHRLEAFGWDRVWLPGYPGGFYYTPLAVREQAHEFFQFPSETLEVGYGDCADTTILLCSLARLSLEASRVFVATGWRVGPRGEAAGHAWLVADIGGFRVVETTEPPSPFPWPLEEEAPGYEAQFYFNDQEIRASPNALESMCEGTMMDGCWFRVIQ